MIKKTITIVVGCDCDPDRLIFGGVNLSDKFSPQVWTGLEQGAPILISLLDQLPFFVPVTWNIRCDDQLLLCHGYDGWSLVEHADIWSMAQKRGDEIAWHNHTLRFSEKDGCWLQEVDDESWIKERFAKWGETFKKEMGAIPFTSHGGWFFQNNATLKALSKTGVNMDYSSLPGRRQNGFPSIEGSCFVNHYDWNVSPRTPYFPSKIDYRRPAKTGEDSLPLLVAPTYTFESLAGSVFQFLSYFSRRKNDKQKVNTAQSKMTIITITNSPILFSGLIDYAVNEEPNILFCYFHPDELMEKKPNLRTRIFSAKNIIANILNIKNKMERAGFEVKFKTAREAVAPYFEENPT